MKPWPIFSLLLLAQQPAVFGQDAPAWVEKERLGEAALRDGLWEVAELHFRDCLDDPGLTPEVKARVAVRIAESLVREGNPAQALELLGQSFATKSPEMPFWKAQALAGQHRFAEAAGIFSTLLSDPATPHRTEVGFTLASLQLALDQPEAALDTLAKLLPEANAATTVRIQLYQVEILLDLKHTQTARQVMPSADAVAPTDRPLLAFLEAQLQLNEGQPLTAEKDFQELLNHPEGQSLNRFHSAAIGRADAIRAQGNPEEAANSLLSFLQTYPDSPLLAVMFSRVLDWLPEKPTTTDPILERLTAWVTDPVVPAVNRIGWNYGDGASAWPITAAPSDPSERLIFSIYTRAIGLHRSGTAKSIWDAKQLMTRLRVEYPDHMLAGRSLYLSARWLLDSGSADQAFTLLDTLRDTAKTPELKGEAAFARARAAYMNGDPKQAIQLFDEAAHTLAPPEARTARLQEAIARLRGGDVKGVTLIQNQTSATDKELEADLDLERALSTTSPAAAKPLLEEFLKHFPDHPRAAEARLAAAEAALTAPSPDLEFAKKQLDALSSAPENLALRIALARLRVLDLSKDTAAAMTAAQAVIDTYPNDPAAAEASLTLGRNLFQNGNYNQARLILEGLAFKDTNPVRAQAAALLAARSAAQGGTPSSMEEALKIFDKAIEFKGPLSSIATLEKASHLKDMFRLPEASAFLTKWIKTLPENDPLQLPAGLLLGETLYAQGSGNPASLVEALAVYDRLLAHAKNQPALLDRLQYLRGMTLEQLPDPKKPGRKRDEEAFLAYYSVLETTTAPAEWEYFERCGFGALTLLEKAGRWRTAVAVAQKIASFKGPQSEVAAARAKQIMLEQMIFEGN